MIQNLSPVSDAWLYTFVIQPHLEGIGRLNFLLDKPKPSLFETPPLSLKEKLIYLISGVSLMIPLIATIAWVFMQTFGNPESFSEPFPPTQSQNDLSPE